jgi:hypothetical protein
MTWTRKYFAKGYTKPGVMNKVEASYGDLLKLRQIAGEVAWYQYEGITLKLAPDTRYTPDFVVMTSEGFLECHEVKGFMRDDAHVKLKCAANMFPFKFYLIRSIPKKHGGGWDIKEV